MTGVSLLGRNRMWAENGMWGTGNLGARVADSSATISWGPREPLLVDPVSYLPPRGPYQPPLILTASSSRRDVVAAWFSSRLLRQEVPQRPTMASSATFATILTSAASPRESWDRRNPARPAVASSCFPSRAPAGWQQISPLNCRFAASSSRLRVNGRLMRNSGVVHATAAAEKSIHDYTVKVGWDLVGSVFFCHLSLSVYLYRIRIIFVLMSEKFWSGYRREECVS